MHCLVVECRCSVAGRKGATAQFPEKVTKGTDPKTDECEEFNLGTFNSPDGKVKTDSIILETNINETN